MRWGTTNRCAHALKLSSRHTLAVQNFTLASINLLQSITKENDLLMELATVREQ